MEGKGKGKATTESIPNMFNIILEWLQPGLLTVNSKANIRDAIRKLKKMEANGNKYTSAWGGLSWRQVLLDEIEIAERGMQPEQKGTLSMLEFVHFKHALRNSIRPPGQRMKWKDLEELEYHPLVQLCREKLHFIYSAWSKISCSTADRLEFRNMFPSRYEKIENRLYSLPPELYDAFSKIYESEKRVTPYEDNSLGALDFAKNIINHINDDPRLKINTRKKQNFWMKDTEGSSTVWIRKNEAERGIVYCFPELAPQILSFFNARKQKIKDLLFGDKDILGADPWVIPPMSTRQTKKGVPMMDGYSWKGVASGEVSVQYYEEYTSPNQSIVNANPTGGDSAGPFFSLILNPPRSQHTNKIIPAHDEKELVQHIINTIEEAGGRIQTNMIAGKLNAKNWTWNKQQHGSLQTFIEAHKETFVMDKKSGYSSLKNIPETAEAPSSSSSLSSGLADDSIEKTAEALSSSSLSSGLIDDSIAASKKKKKKKKGTAN